MFDHSNESFLIVKKDNTNHNLSSVIVDSMLWILFRFSSGILINSNKRFPHMIRKLTLALLLTLPSIALAIDLEGYYITAKGGVSKTFNTGTTSSVSAGNLFTFQNEDLGTGSAFGFSVGKYLNDNFRLELEAIKRAGYEYDARVSTAGLTSVVDKAKIQTEAVFINGFYDFQSFSIRNTAITPYLGGGVGISRNKMGTVVENNNGLPTGTTFNDDSINQFTYKLSAGTLVSLTEQLSLDVNYQYVNLGAFKGGSTRRVNGVHTSSRDLQRPINGGDIKTQELMVGLQYTCLLYTSPSPRDS